MKIKFPAFLKVFGRSAVDWYDSWLDMTLIGMIWLAAQATVILGPAATFGVCYVTSSMVRSGESLGVKGLFEGARKYFLKATAWGALNWLVAVISVVNFIFYMNVESTFGYIARVLIAVLTLLWLMTQFYTVPFLLAQEQENLFLALRNGFYMTLASLPYTVGLMIIVALIIALCVVLILPAFLGVSMLISVMGTHALYDRLEAFGLRKKDPDPKEVG
jgi:uncharacterized membrane protein YesL